MCAMNFFKASTYAALSPGAQILCSNMAQTAVRTTNGLRLVEFRGLRHDNACSISSARLALDPDFYCLCLESAPRGDNLHHLCLDQDPEVELYLEVFPCVCYDFQDVLRPRIDDRP
jgi:hypothetical protein